MDVIGIGFGKRPAQLVEIGDEARVLGLHRPIGADQPLGAFGQPRAAAALAAGGARDQRLAGAVVHGVDGVPRGLVAEAHGTRGGSDRAMLANRGQQRDAVASAPVLRAGAKPDGALEF
ncbi:hypothetical protein D3C86_1757200 [compost metagenome]